ncbi:cytochrome b/b6 domain-containing protein [Microbacterium oleivorans]|uniref:cytochrome b/b6 domain-containing protein n=1 Tax=Microbacterium oleivorans TaxID=273677 RepID=UPI00197B5B87|nr:cytochrome b/b6 domain-containing protein [Microbacterium oleivorans]
MATYARSVRRGLPRASGGDPWPPPTEAPASVADAATAPAADVAAETPTADVVTPRTESATTPPAESVPPAPASGTEEDAAPPHPAASPATATRRGLPRTPGGEPWPPASTGPSPAEGAAPAEHRPAPEAAPPASTAASAPRPTDDLGAAPPESVPVAASIPAAGAVRRGLPRAAGEDAWPPAETTPAPRAAPPSRETARGDRDSDLAPQSRRERAVSASSEPESAPKPAAPTPAPKPAAPTPAPAAPTAPAPPTPAAPDTPRAPLAERPLAHAGVARRPAQKPDPARIGPFTKAQWVGVVVFGGGAVLYVAAMAVLAVRWVLSLEPLQDFLATYPGEYHLPEGAPVGFPAWLNWSHFLNAFFIVLIIRTGLQVRSEKRPAAFWISKKDRKRRMSLTLWLHQALDVLWLANGLIFVVLLFVTGQWMRVIPTSWEVFPNALSAALQYVSLDWPTENGWVNYNALQQLAYFATIFIAAPLAAITGYRMSAVWPKQATTLNRLYPVEWARKLHFPTMLYFVLFIVVHVALVLSTGALRNLGHMYAATGSTDPEAYADNWTGFWLFALSIAVTVAAYVAMRPLVVAPIARLFGEVKSR